MQTSDVKKAAIAAGITTPTPWKSDAGGDNNLTCVGPMFNIDDINQALQTTDYADLRSLCAWNGGAFPNMGYVCSAGGNSNGAVAQKSPDHKPDPNLLKYHRPKGNVVQPVIFDQLCDSLCFCDEPVSSEAQQWDDIYYDGTPFTEGPDGETKLEKMTNGVPWGAGLNLQYETAAMQAGVAAGPNNTNVEDEWLQEESNSTTTTNATTTVDNDCLNNANTTDAIEACLNSTSSSTSTDDDPCAGLIGGDYEDCSSSLTDDPCTGLNGTDYSDCVSSFTNDPCAGLNGTEYEECSNGSFGDPCAGLNGTAYDDCTSSSFSSIDLCAGLNGTDLADCESSTIFTDDPCGNLTGTQYDSCVNSTIIDICAGLTGTDLQDCQSGSLLDDPCAGLNGTEYDSCSSASFEDPCFGLNGTDYDSCVSEYGSLDDPCANLTGVAYDGCLDATIGSGDFGSAGESVIDDCLSQNITGNALQSCMNAGGANVTVISDPSGNGTDVTIIDNTGSFGNGSDTSTGDSDASETDPCFSATTDEDYIACIEAQPGFNATIDGVTAVTDTIPEVTFPAIAGNRGGNNTRGTAPANTGAKGATGAAGAGNTGRPIDTGKLPRDKMWKRRFEPQGGPVPTPAPRAMMRRRKAF